VIVRRWRLIARVAVFGAVILAFPSAGSALSPLVFVALTPSGPSPIVLTFQEGPVPVWDNQDAVTHTVVFANGLCSFQLLPGRGQSCNGTWEPTQPGTYPYTVDGKFPGSVVVTAGPPSPPIPPPTVTLTARDHTIRRAANLRLHGTLNSPGECDCSPPTFRGQPVMVLARPDRHHPFRRIATAQSRRRESEGGYHWRLDLHPTTKTIFIAYVTYQPAGEQGLRRSWSRPFRVRVRARTRAPS
jgi:hypothetical protein